MGVVEDGAGSREETVRDGELADEGEERHLCLATDARPGCDWSC